MHLRLNVCRAAWRNFRHSERCKFSPHRIEPTLSLQIRFASPKSQEDFLLEKLLGFQMYVRLLRTNGFREICLLKPNKMKYPPWLKIIVLWSPQKRISQSVSVKKMSFGFNMYAPDFTKIIENLPLMHLSLNIAGGRKEILV